MVQQSDYWQTGENLGQSRAASLQMRLTILDLVVSSSSLRFYEKVGLPERTAAADLVANLVAEAMGDSFRHPTLVLCVYRVVSCQIDDETRAR